MIEEIFKDLLKLKAILESLFLSAKSRFLHSEVNFESIFAKLNYTPSFSVPKKWKKISIHFNYLLDPHKIKCIEDMGMIRYLSRNAWKEGKIKV